MLRPAALSCRFAFVPCSPRAHRHVFRSDHATMMRPGRLPDAAVADVGPPVPARPQPSHPRAERPDAPAPNRRTTLLSFAGLAWAPGALLDALKGEAGLWQQEAELYKRQAASALSEATGAQQASGREAADAAARLRLDPGLAAALLAAPLEALKRGGSGLSSSSSGSSGGSAASPAVPQLPRLDMEQYQRDYAALLQQELPYFQKAGACGHCGTAGDSSEALGLTDRAYFDFVSYIQFKAISRQLGAAVTAGAGAGGSSTALSGWERMHAGSPDMQLRAAEDAWQASLAGQASLFRGSGGGFGGGGGAQEELERAAAAAARARGQQVAARDGSSAPKLTPGDALRLLVGGEVLQCIEGDLAAAARSGGSGGSQAQAALAAVGNTSPDLDAVRAGAQQLLGWFASKGFIAGSSCQQFGLSLDEYENHYVWSLGEPAFLKYWLESPATMRSSAALDQEEGFSQDYVAATLQAYFRRCGVAAGTLKRYPSYSQPDLVAEQWTLRRVTPLPEGHDWQQYQEWRPDACPGSDEDACY